MSEWQGNSVRRQRRYATNAINGTEEDRVVIVQQCDNIDELRGLGLEWIRGSHADDYGLDVDIEVVLADLKSWMDGEGVVLIARDNDEIIAVFAMFAVPSYLGRQKIALEKYWYSRKGCHFAGPKLYMEAIKWAKEHGCSHLISGGSKMASDRHDSICDFLERTGAQHFETLYIYKLGDK